MTPSELPAVEQNELATILFNMVHGGTNDPTLEEMLWGICYSSVATIIAAGYRKSPPQQSKTVEVTREEIDKALIASSTTEWTCISPYVIKRQTDAILALLSRSTAQDEVGK